MSNEKFCLKWNDFESNISIAFRDLRDHSEFFDITLACEDNQIQAHKVILSACSPFFRTVLARNSTHPNPLIYLRGIKFTDLESVLNFMYHGEVNVAQDQLNSFLTVAEDLRVKGLTQNKNGESSAEKRSRSPPSSTAKSHQGMSSTDRELQPPPLKRPRPPTSTTNAGRTVNNPAGGESISTGNSALQTENDDDDIQEVVPVKSEPKELVPLASTAQPTLPPSSPTVGGVNECQPANSSQSYHSQAIVHQDEYEENYEDYGQYDDQYIDHQEHLPDSDKGFLTSYPQYEAGVFDGGDDIQHSSMFDNSKFDLKIVKGSRYNSVHLVVNDQYPCTLNTAKRFPFVQWKCTKYCSSATRCPVVFWSYVANHRELRQLNPDLVNPLDLAKDLRAIHKHMPKRECKMFHNHD